MVKYRVELSALAYVSQVQYVEANSEEEASKIALKNAAYVTWEYEGTTDHPIETIECTRITSSEYLRNLYG